MPFSWLLGPSYRPFLASWAARGFSPSLCVLLSYKCDGSGSYDFGGLLTSIYWQSHNVEHCRLLGVNAWGIPRAPTIDCRGDHNPPSCGRFIGFIIVLGEIKLVMLTQAKLIPKGWRTSAPNNDTLLIGEETYFKVISIGQFIIVLHFVFPHTTKNSYQILRKMILAS